ncbi:MAG: hypothetical protein K9L30_06290 [Desulfobacterales bacterium]|nr:hypothetical protein [Desulfobacterales bacterium]
MKFIVPETYRSVIGNEIRIEIKGSLSLRSIIFKWPEAISEKIFISKELNDEIILSQFLFFREDKIVRLDDKISNQDIVKILLTATGG